MTPTTSRIPRGTKGGDRIMNALLKNLLRHIAPSLAPATDSGSVSGLDARHDTMPANDWRSIHRPADLSIRCVRGRVTITQEGDPRDVLLVAGESYDVARNEHLYVQAQREAELRFASLMAANKVL
jgi:hypothetical protein